MRNVDARARRIALNAGLIAKKSRWRKDSADNFGDFMLVDPSTNGVVSGARFDMTAAEVIEFCRPRSAAE